MIASAHSLRRVVQTIPSALEAAATCAGPSARVWYVPSGSARLGLNEALAHATRGGAWPEERPLARASLPRDLPDVAARNAPGRLLPALLGPASKRALDLLSDWPWITPRDLGRLLGVSARRVSQLVAPLEDAGLVTRIPGHSLALSDHGLALLARRDRAAVGMARKRWSATPLDPEGPPVWRNISGRRSRQLLRNLEHTAAVHGFIAALSQQAPDLGWDVVQFDPPHRASRYFRYGDVLRSIHPDAFGVLRRGGDAWPFFLEWERRAVRPVTMAARLAPYLRYYASARPTDDHGTRPAVLVVFEDELAASHFLRVARGAMERATVTVPLWVSHQRLLRTEGLPGRSWNTLNGREPTHLLVPTWKRRRDSASEPARIDVRSCRDIGRVCTSSPRLTATSSAPIGRSWRGLAAVTNPSAAPDSSCDSRPPATGIHCTGPLRAARPPANIRYSPSPSGNASPAIRQTRSSSRWNGKYCSHTHPSPSASNSSGTR